MPNIRATLFFEFGKFGWTESYVRVEASPLSAQQAGEDLLVARRKILAFNCTLNRVRLSDVDVFRDSALIDIPLSTGKAMQVEKMSEPWSCLLCRMDSLATYRKNIYLRGVPDIEIDPNNKLTDLNPAYLGDVNAYLRFLVNRNWGFMVRDVNPVNGALQPISGQVVGVDPTAAPPLIKVTTKVNHLLADGDKVIIRGVKGTKGINGVHRVLVTGAGGTDKFYVQGVDDTRLYQGGGLFRLFKQSFAPMTDGKFLNVAKRDTGRPSSSPHGRRLTRRP